MKTASILKAVSLVLVFFSAQIFAAELAEGAPDANEAVYDEAHPADCSGVQMLVRFEDYDAKTRTFEVIDPLCDGQGPFYSTIEVIGNSIPKLWMKKDPALYLNHTFKMERDFEFHPTRKLAVQERARLLKANKLNQAPHSQPSR